MVSNETINATAISEPTTSGNFIIDTLASIFKTIFEFINSFVITNDSKNAFSEFIFSATGVKIGIGEITIALIFVGIWISCSALEHKMDLIRDILRGIKVICIGGILLIFIGVILKVLEALI